jgi:hypothetical protein
VSKQTPPSLTALGSRSLPDEIAVFGKTYRLARVFKNDFFAITSMYESEDSRVLLKVGRQASFLAVPLRWIGRILADREVSAMQKLSDIDGIPALIDRWEDTGFVREYVEGEPLKKGMPVPDDFHARLAALIEQIHDRKMAYVDLEKCENVLVGEDGRPYLFDFQICWQWSSRWGGELWPVRRLRRWFQNGDRYHLLKLQRRTRPDQMSQEALAESYRRPWYVHVHRWLTRPFTLVRRAILNRVDPRQKRGERGRVSDNESIGAV